MPYINAHLSHYSFLKNARKTYVERFKLFHLIYSFISQTFIKQFVLRSYARIKINISDCVPRKIVASYMYNIQSYLSNQIIKYSYYKPICVFPVYTGKTERRQFLSYSVKSNFSHTPKRIASSLDALASSIILCPSHISVLKNHKQLRSYDSSTYRNGCILHHHMLFNSISYY